MKGVINRAQTHKEVHMKKKLTTNAKTNQELATSGWDQDGKPEWLRVDRVNGQTWYMVVVVIMLNRWPSYYGPFPTREAAEVFYDKVQDAVGNCECSVLREAMNKCQDLDEVAALTIRSKNLLLQTV
jgi:hypothetical protein